MLNDIICAIDSKQNVMLILLDLSAAFDTIDHDIMLERLEDNCGVTGKCLDWLRSYFSERTQEVSIDGCSSTTHPLDTGVPQGSVAGPFSFPEYTHPITSIANNFNTLIHLKTIHSCTKLLP